MTDQQETARAVIDAFLIRNNKAPSELTDDVRLFDDLALDSLEAAELSALLEDELGSDPFSSGMPLTTVGEILAFYAPGDAPAAGLISDPATPAIS